MITKGQLISDVKNELRMLNADYRVSNKFIWNIIQKHSLWLIKEDSDKLRLIRNNSIFQTLKCVEVVSAPTIDDCCGIRSRCSVQRTEKKLPEMYEDSDGVIIKSIYSLDGSVEFTQITVQQYIRKLADPNFKYDKSNYCYYNNGWLYFPKSTVRKIMIKAYFQEDISKYNICDDTFIDPCKTRLDDTFNLPTYLQGRLMDAVFKDLGITRQIPNDPQINKIENQ